MRKPRDSTIATMLLNIRTVAIVESRGFLREYHHNMKLWIFLAFLALSSLSSTCAFSFSLLRGPHIFSAGPEAYYLKRSKEGGSKQDGWLFGVRGTYERLVPRGLYWGVDGYWAEGDIKGKTSSGNKLKSTLTDSQVEGRIGYAFNFGFCPKLLIVPFGAYGYFSSKNDFRKPSPIPCTFHDRFDYGAAGFLTWWRWCTNWESGCLFKVAWMIEGKCKVSDDPEYDDLSQVIGNETQYEVDLPFRYRTCWRGLQTGISITPFFRYRHYGFQENYPFDCIETRFRIFGARVLLHLLF